MTGGLQHLDDGSANLERRAILHRLDLVTRATGCALVNRAVGDPDNFHVSGDEVGVGVGQIDALDRQAMLCRVVEVELDVPIRINNQRFLAAA